MAVRPVAGDRRAAVAPSHAITVDFGIDDLAALRSLAAKVANRAGLTARRTEDLMLVVSELASNGIRHGRAPRTITIWHGADGVTCETTNGGEMADVDVGRQRPAPDKLAGRGVWIMRQLCRVVQIRSGNDRTVVRVTLS